jgi:hypothetical protein
MTELEPYQPVRMDLRDPQTDSWTDVLEQVADLANKIAKTDFVPEGFRGNIAATAAAILYGREVGLGPMQALSSLHSIKGRVAMSAEAMRAQALAAGHDLAITESTTAKCTVKGRRRNSEEWTTVTWTIDNARQAKLGGDNWTKYPRQMLQARATAELCRLIFADVIHGLAAVEELEQEGGQLIAAVETSRVQRRRAITAPTVDPPLDDTRTAGPGTSPGPGPVKTAEVTPDPAEGADDTPRSSAPPPETSDGDITTQPSDPGPGTHAGDPGPTQATAAQVAQVIALTRQHHGTITDLLTPLTGRPISRTSQLTPAEADFVIEELTAQLKQAEDGPMFDDTP